MRELLSPIRNRLQGKFGLASGLLQTGWCSCECPSELDFIWLLKSWLLHVCVSVCVLVDGNKPKCSEMAKADLARRFSVFRPLFFWMLFHFHPCNLMRSHGLAGQADDVQHWFFPTEDLPVLITCLCTSLTTGELDCVCAMKWMVLCWHISVSLSGASVQKNWELLSPGQHCALLFCHRAWPCCCVSMNWLTGRTGKYS